jgi:hypothetical protein
LAWARHVTTGGTDLNVRTWQHLAVAASLVILPRVATAQVTPAASYTPPDDTPTIKVGATIFADYTYTQEPKTTDADGNIINPNAFQVQRAYINVTGNISHMIAFRITPDVVRDAETGTSQTPLSGALVYRLKYAFFQVNLDDWTGQWKQTYVRFGQQTTPYIDFMEGIYRYRFQGTTYTEREGFQSSADSGVAFHTNIPNNYGDIHVGYYNGDTYTKAEANDQKGFEIRGSVRPFAQADPILRGLRFHAFTERDAYIEHGPRNRFIFSTTFEHKYVNAGFDYLNAEDQTRAALAKVKAEGVSFWVTPRTTFGLEGLFRYDSTKPNKTVDARRKRTIAGVAYWFPHQGTVSTAILLDYEQYEFDKALNQPRQQRIAVHSLVNF